MHPRCDGVPAVNAAAHTARAVTRSWATRTCSTSASCRCSIVRSVPRRADGRAATRRHRRIDDDVALIVRLESDAERVAADEPQLIEAEPSTSMRVSLAGQFASRDDSVVVASASSSVRCRRTPRPLPRNSVAAFGAPEPGVTAGATPFRRTPSRGGAERIGPVQRHPSPGGCMWVRIDPHAFALADRNAEREGFEPPGLVGLPLSRRVHLSALPPFRLARLATGVRGGAATPPGGRCPRAGRRTAASRAAHGPA